MTGRWFGFARPKPPTGHAQIIVDVEYGVTNEFEVKVMTYPQLDALTVAAVLQRAARDVGELAKP